jgi:lyso-ornithine lipid O-acyltransferase
VTTWRPEEEPALAALTVAGWGRALLRGALLGLLTAFGLVLMMVVRLVERPVCGAARPVTPFITQAVCRLAMLILGTGYGYHGQPMLHRGAIVANHSSWLDIFALNACQRVYFVSKAEVSRWPFIGWLARATGTLFIERDPRRARTQQAEFEARLRAGHRLLFFPEGTSTDGMRVLPFKSTLFQAFYSHGLEHVMQIQPVTVAYHAPDGADKRFYGWWGEMDFAPHLLHTLAAARQGRVEVIFHPPVSVDAFASRKALAKHCEIAVRTGLAAALGAAIDPTDR